MKMAISRFFSIKMIFILLALATVFACTKDSIIVLDFPYNQKTAKQFNGRVVTDWNKMFLNVSANVTGYRAPVAARVLGYLNWAGYEAIAPGMVNYQSIAKNYSTIQLPQINPSETYHWVVCANAAYYHSMLAYVPKADPTRKKMIDSLYNIYNRYASIECDSLTFKRSQEFGKQVSAAILAYANTDGGKDVYLNNKPMSYQIPKGDGLWAVTFPDFLRPLTPYWGSVRPIVVKPDAITFQDPIPYSKDSTSAFYQQAKEVYVTAKKATPEQLWQGDFWSDDIQFWTFDTASRFISIAIQILETQKSDLEISAFTTAKVGIALFDGSVICWKEKYQYNVLRPVTFIRENIDAQWVTNLDDKIKNTENSKGVTPAHPAYPSGHSTFGEAASIVLADIFGSNFAFTDNSHKMRTDMLGMPRSFKNFDEMSKENAYSRIPLGVHYRMDCEEGLRIGKIVGSYVNALPWKKSKTIL
jgi:PAP2 superfamily